ncbi:protein dpy-30 homolog isoform X2 [Pipistrellus kuhlii]|uniref:protein dpy-30 homolog isoform X2 n=1 Tax=Pipistrellus kuhlii TaxID=59472 RepID=UPI001E270EB5|nr:protein dpy-30 homolog isoform X2 [Pipistrellus kuhlii]
MELPDLTRAPGRGLPPPPPARGDPAPRTGIRDGDSQGPPWSRSRCWRDRRRLQKTLTPSTGSQITWRWLCLPEFSTLFSTQGDCGFCFDSLWFPVLHLTSSPGRKQG